MAPRKGRMKSSKNEVTSYMGGGTHSMDIKWGGDKSKRVEDLPTTGTWGDEPPFNQSEEGREITFASIEWYVSQPERPRQDRQTIPEDFPCQTYVKKTRANSTPDRWKQKREHLECHLVPNSPRKVRKKEKKKERRPRKCTDGMGFTDQQRGNVSFVKRRRKRGEQENLLGMCEKCEKKDGSRP